MKAVICRKFAPRSELRLVEVASPWGAFARANPHRNRENMQQLHRWFEEGRIRPHISAEYPLDRFADALDAVMEGAAKGKVVLRMNST